MQRIRPQLRRWGVAVLTGGAILAASTSATADTLGPITFEQPDYQLGTINTQQGWSKIGGYDAAVASIATFPWASRYRFGAQALRISNAVTSGSFGDQTFSPKLAVAATEANVHARHFEASFRIGTTQSTEQAGLRLSVSPDGGDGSRMSYLAFNDSPEGVRVVFFDVANAGPHPTVSDFNGTEIAVLSRRRAHTVRFVMHLKPGPGNDIVKISIDGRLRAKGTSWEDYYRYDPEQDGVNPLHKVPAISKLLFRASGSPVLANAGQGYLIDSVRLRSGNPLRTRAACRVGGRTAQAHTNGRRLGHARACSHRVARKASIDRLRRPSSGDHHARHSAR